MRRTEDVGDSSVLQTAEPARRAPLYQSENTGRGCQNSEVILRVSTSAQTTYYALRVLRSRGLTKKLQKRRPAAHVPQA